MTDQTRMARIPRFASKITLVPGEERETRSETRGSRDTYIVSPTVSQIGAGQADNSEIGTIRGSARGCMRLAIY